MNEFEKHSQTLEQYDIDRDNDINFVTRQDLVEQFLQDFEDAHLANAELKISMEYKKVKNYLRASVNKLLKEAAKQLTINQQ